MSSFNDANNNDSSIDWKPMNFNELEQFVTPEVSQVRESLSETESGFSMLYEGESTKEEPEEFSVLYSKGETYDEKTTKPENEKETAVEPIVAEAETEIPVIDTSEIEKKAYEEGFAKGEADGVEAGKEKINETLESFKQTILNVENIWTDMVNTYESQILSLISRVVEKVVYEHVAVNHEVVKSAILDAFKLIPEPMDVDIHLCPEDYEYIENVKEDLFKEIKGLKNVTVMTDPAVTRGGCRIQTRTGEVNSSIESRLEKVQQSLIESKAP